MQRGQLRIVRRRRLAVEWREPAQLHAVLGQRPRLVDTKDGGRSEGLDDRGAARRHLDARTSQRKCSSSGVGAEAIDVIVLPMPPTRVARPMLVTSPMPCPATTSMLA